MPTSQMPQAPARVCSEQPVPRAPALSERAAMADGADCPGLLVSMQLSSEPHLLLQYMARCVFTAFVQLEISELLLPAAGGTGGSRKLMRQATAIPVHRDQVPTGWPCLCPPCLQSASPHADGLHHPHRLPHRGPATGLCLSTYGCSPPLGTCSGDRAGPGSGDQLVRRCG
jgi:hypothetical protein